MVRVIVGEFGSTVLGSNLPYHPIPPTLKLPYDCSVVLTSEPPGLGSTPRIATPEPAPPPSWQIKPCPPHKAASSGGEYRNTQSSPLAGPVETSLTNRDEPLSHPHCTDCPLQCDTGFLILVLNRCVFVCVYVCESPRKISFFFSFTTKQGREKALHFPVLVHCEFGSSHRKQSFGGSAPVAARPGPPIHTMGTLAYPCPSGSFPLAVPT